VLVVHGARDDRIPLDAVDEAVRALEAEGADVMTRIAPGEDHFLFFSRVALVRRWIGDWLRPRLGASRFGARPHRVRTG
jgi:predicted esterase